MGTVSAERSVATTLLSVSWSIDGTDVTTQYAPDDLFGPWEGEPSRLEWLLKSLAADGCFEVKVGLCV